MQVSAPRWSCNGRGARCLLETKKKDVGSKFKGRKNSFDIRKETAWGWLGTRVNNVARIHCGRKNLLLFELLCLLADFFADPGLARLCYALFWKVQWSRNWTRLGTHTIHVHDASLEFTSSCRATPTRPSIVNNVPANVLKLFFYRKLKA